MEDISSSMMEEDSSMDEDTELGMTVSLMVTLDDVKRLSPMMGTDPNPPLLKKGEAIATVMAIAEMRTSTEIAEFIVSV